ncbi:DUF4347 domain-containing protein [Paraburkholderia bannensis]|uniref:DUF4347 domain-containing protein n=1 Tax=Paraburkholderia bannensis TaxID=765414 RepID=UPI002AB63C34|nr:DUF4347 domain-containing protein [Paraburkholderia bannensis]
MNKIVKHLLERWNAGAVARTPRTSAAPLMLALEPRVVYDASVAAVAPAAHTHEAAHEHTHETAHRTQTETTTPANAATGDTASSSSTKSSSASSSQSSSAKTATNTDTAKNSTTTSSTATADTTQAATVSALEAAASARDTSGSHQVVFVDPAVANYQTLLTGLPAGTQVVVLDANSDGFAQIAQYLQTHSGVSAIHLISHGADGEIQAGSAWLNLGDLSAYSAELTAIGAAMKPGGDFLIYGCDVAEDASGKALVQQIATLTHLNVAASTDATGATALGGDWTLEYHVGDVRTEVIVSAAAEQQYDGLLAQSVENFTTAFDTNSNVTSFTLDGITYTTNVARETATGTDPYMQALSAASANSGALIFDTQGVGGITTVTLTLTGGKHINLQTLDIDVLADANVTITADGNTADAIVISSAGLWTAEEISFAGHSSFANATTITITGGNIVLNLGRMVYSDPAPVLSNTAGASTNYTVGSSQTVIDNTVTVADANGLTPQTATVTIGSGAQANDILSFSNTNSTLYGNITSSYNLTTHVLSLSSSGNTATIAQWQAALDAVTFSTASGTSPGNRTINYAVNDGYATSNTVTHTIAVQAGPSIVTDSGSAAFVAADNAPSTPVAIDSGLTLSDVTSTTLTSATVAITGNFHASEDVLGFTNDGTMGNIAASYNHNTGVLTLTSAGGTATLAQWQAALREVTYVDMAVTPNSATRTLSFQASDSIYTSTVATRTVTVTDVDQTPTLADSGGSTSYQAGGSAVAIDSGLTVSDLDNTTLSAATISISSGFQIGDVLSITNGAYGNISGAFNAGTGVLTLSSSGATATLAQWQAALDSVSFSNSSGASSGTRTVSFTVNDGLKSSAALSHNVVVANGPAVTTDGGSASFVSGDNVASTPVAIDPGLTVTDPNSSTLASATVSITGNHQIGEDVLGYSNDGATMGDIYGAYNFSTGVLTLVSSSGTATLAQWQSALRSVTYTDTAVTPTSATRTISFQINDSTQSSTVATRTVTVTDTDQTPLIGGGGAAASFVAGDNVTSTPVAIATDVTVSDLDNTTLAAASVSIVGNFRTGDILSFINTSSTQFGNIVASYNSATGVLTMTSSGAVATLAQWDNALQSVTYTSTTITPYTGTRTVSFAVSDGSKTSTAYSVGVQVSDTDQTPLIGGSSGSVTFTQGDNVASTPVTIDSGITLSDRDNTTLQSATVTIGNYDSQGDVIGFVNDGATMGNITGVYSNGVLTLNSVGGTATLAQWQSALRSLTFDDTAPSPSTATRTISFVVNDGVKSSTAWTRSVNVVSTDQSPVLTASSGSAAFTAGDNVASTPVAVDTGIALSDLDSPTMQSGTVAITGNFHAGEDVLALGAGSFGDITATYNSSTGVLILSSGGASTLAQWQAALRSVTYTDTAITPAAATRTISFTVNDGTKNSASVTRTVTVADTDQTPVLTASQSSLTYLQGTSAQNLDSGLTLSDRDSVATPALPMTITIQFASGFQSGDLLALNYNNLTMGTGFSASFNGVNGEFIVTSASGKTLAQWNAILDGIQFSTSTSVGTGTRTLSITANDGTKTSTALSYSIDVVSSAPVLSTTSTGSASFVAGDNSASVPVAVDSNLSLADPLGNVVDTATVAITGNMHSGEDVLGFTNDGLTMGDITGTYNAITGVLTLNSVSGSATLAQWQSALRSVTYTDTAVTPNVATRTISFSVSDGTQTSTALTRTVTITQTDQTPILSSINTGSASFVAGDNTASTPVAIDNGISVTDLDNTTLSSATVQIGAGFHAGEDVLGFVNDGATMGNITASYDPATGTLTLTSGSATATLAQWQSALSAVTYTDTAITPDTTTRTISFSVNDGTKTSAAITRNVTVTDTDQTPILTSSNTGSTSFVAGDNTAATPVVIDNGISVSDLDNTTLSSATVQIGAGFHIGEDVLSFVNDGATMGNITASYNAATGTLMLASSGATATLAQWQSALRAVTYTDTAITPDTTTRTISFSVNDGTKASSAITRNVSVTDTDQTPVLSSSNTGSASFTAADNAASTPVVIDNGISVSDLDNTTLASATVQIGAGFHAGEDVLSFVNDGATMGDITASYNAATGTLTLTSSSATATLVQWQSALSAVTYTDTAVTPDTTTRTISFSVNDGTKTSTAITRDVTVTDTDQTPVLSSSNTGSASFIAGDNAASTPVVIDNGIAVSDLDNATLSSATVQIGAGFHAGEDVLSFVNDGATMGNITASYNAATGTLTLTSGGATATLAQWQTALRAVTYTDTAVTPDTTQRTISFSVNDGTKTSTAITRDVTVADTDQTPVLSSSNTGSASFVSADNAASTPVVIDNGISVSDLDNATLSSATVQIGAGFHAGEDVLSFVNDQATMGNITATYNAATGTLTLTSGQATATLAQWQSALRAVTYTDTAVTPDTTTRTISFSVNDGTKTSTAITRNVTVADTDQTPQLSSSNSGSASFVSADNAVSTPVVIDNGISVSDLDNATLSSATVQIGAGFHAGEDVLSFANDGATMGNITASYNATTGTLTLASSGATATLAQWQAALRSVTYTDTAAAPDTTQRTISFSVNDGTKTSAAITRTVAVTATHQTLVVSVGTGDGSTLTYTANGDKTATLNLGSGVTLTDANATPPTSATIAITGNFDAQHDLLVFTPSAATGDISGSYDASTGVLKLSSANGTATLAQWQAALGSIGYRDTQTEHHDSTRTISFTVSDGASTSASVTRTLQIAGVPDPVGTPILPGTPGTSATTSQSTQTTAHGLPPLSNSPSTNPLIVNDDSGRNDGVSNPLIVLDTFAQTPEVGSIVVPVSFTFTPDGVHGRSLGDTHVDALGSIVPSSVNDAAEPAQSLPTVQVHTAGHDDGSFSLSLTSMSPNHSAHADQGASTTSLTQADGEPLPSWLHYDATSGVLSGVPPRGVHEVRVMLTTRDASGHVTRREVVVSLDTHSVRNAHDAGAAPSGKNSTTPANKGGAAQTAPHASLAKPSLAAQFASAHAALHVAHAQTVARSGTHDVQRNAPGLDV